MRFSMNKLFYYRRKRVGRSDYLDKKFELEFFVYQIVLIIKLSRAD